MTNLWMSLQFYGLRGGLLNIGSFFPITLKFGNRRTKIPKAFGRLNITLVCFVTAQATLCSISTIDSTMICDSKVSQSKILVV